MERIRPGAINYFNFLAFERGQIAPSCEAPVPGDTALSSGI